MKKLILCSCVLAIGAANTDFAFATTTGSTILETSDQGLAGRELLKGPSIALETSPLTFLLSGYNFGLQIPLSPRFTIGPKVTLFRYSADRYSKTGSQIGMRAHYYFTNDWSSTGIFLKGGFFRDNYTENGTVHLMRDGYAKGLMADLLFGIQLRGNEGIGFSASMGLESSNWKNTPDTYGYFSRREGRTLTPIVELNLSLAI